MYKRGFVFWGDLDSARAKKTGPGADKKVSEGERTEDHLFCTYADYTDGRFSIPSDTTPRWTVLGESITSIERLENGEASSKQRRAFITIILFCTWIHPGVGRHPDGVEAIWD